MSENPYKQMNDEEIEKLFHENPANEVVFAEYHSRLDWKTPPKFSSTEEEEKFIENLIASKTH